MNNKPTPDITPNLAISAYHSNIVLDSQRIAKAADSTNTVQNVFEACHVTGA